MKFNGAKLRRTVSATFLITAGLLCVSVAYGQVDFNTLRSTFGPPVASGPNHEVFESDQGLFISVRGSSVGKKACSIAIKPGLADATTVERVLSLAVPVAARGRMWNELDEYDGISGIRHIYYEKVIILEDIFTSRALDKRPGAVVTFKAKECGWKGTSDPFDYAPHSTPR